MSVRFIIGRAGSGKTRHCLSALRAELHEDPINGPRCFLLVPEQASHQMERALVMPDENDPGPARGSHRVEVFSFQRLAFRILESVSAAPRQALTEPARAMVIAHLLEKNRPRLLYYRNSDRLMGVGQKLAVTITELIQEAVKPEDLTLSLETSSSAADPAQSAKMHDLALIYRAYLDYLGDETLDPSQSLQHAREKISQCPWLHGAKIWVDGFASMSGQEIQSLIALALICDQMHITVLIDPHLIGPSSVARRDPRARLFAKTLRTYSELQRTLAESGIQIEEPLILPQLELPATRPQAAHAFPELAHLERSLFNSETSFPSPAGLLDGVSIAELPSRRVEVEFAVAKILEWVSRSENPLRYRDIALIVRDVSVYHDLLRDAFDARRIPYFMDIRRNIAHHPLVELLRALVLAASSDFRLECLQSLIKTGLLPMPQHELDALENHLLEHGIAGWSALDSVWEFRRGSSFVPKKTTPGKPPTEDPAPRAAAEILRMNAIREQFVACLSPWSRANRVAPKTSGKNWTAAILNCFDQLGVARALATWTHTAQQSGDLDQAQQHHQAWNEVVSFLDDLAFAFADIELSADELHTAIEVGLSQVTLGLVPPTVDQVLVSSIERSRHPAIKAAIILGLNDGVFPQRLSEDSILNDDDRSLLREKGVRVGLPIRERLADEKMLFYIACTRPTQQLVATYCLLDDQGRAVTESPFIKVLQAAVPGLTVKSAADPVQSREMWDIHTFGDLRRSLALEFSDRVALEEDQSPARSQWNELYLETRNRLSADAPARAAFSNLAPPKPVRISPKSVERLHSAGLRTSVSELETYAACPHQHFARYALELRPRPKYEIAPADVGQVHHAILEEFALDLISNNRDLTSLDDQQISDAVRLACDRVATRLPRTGSLAEPRERYRLRRCAAVIARILRCQRDAAKLGKYRIKAAELPFGKSETGLPPLELFTPKGRRVSLKGVIDRVDLAELGDDLLGVVIDYKRTRDKRLDLTRVYHGLSLQLVAYLLVLAKNGRTLAGRPIRPAGAFFLSSADAYQRLDAPQSNSSADPLKPNRSHRPRGLACAEQFVHLDAQSRPGAASDHFSFELTKDGRISRLEYSDGADQNSFNAALKHVERRMGELADGILDGLIDVAPVRLGTFSPCSWCMMADACRFEMGASDTRFLSSWKRSEILQMMQAPLSLVKEMNSEPRTSVRATQAPSPPGRGPG